MHSMSSYWEKQKRLKKLVQKFEKSKKEYMGDKSFVDFTQESEYKRRSKERPAPMPPMSPFEDELKS